MTNTMQQGEPARRRVRWTVVGIVLGGGAVPVILYWLLFGHIATVTPRRAKELLRLRTGSTLLVDVRQPEEFLAGHIDGAVNWPLEEILRTTQPNEAPSQFRGKTLLVVCDVGMASRWAAWHLAGTGVERVVNVRGGIQEWIRSAPGPTGDVFDRWRIGSDQIAEFPFRQSPMFEQVLAVAAFFGIKLIYTILSLLLVIVLWTSRDPDLAALRWGMIFFFLGEAACAINYLALKETSYLLEYLHSLGMLYCFGFTAYAVLEGIDRRILMLSDSKQRCASLSLCDACVKYADVPCGLKRTFYMIIPLCMVLALMLPSADWQDNSYNTIIFGELYNYAHFRVYQQFENWYCAAAAILMFAVSLLILAFKKEDAVAAAKIAFAAGIGPLGFGTLRMVLGAAYDQNRVWFLFWEETTELLFILGVCFALWTFRRRLVPELEPRLKTWADLLLGPAPPRGA